MTDAVQPSASSFRLMDTNSPSKGAARHRSPQCDRRSLHALADTLQNSVQRPGYKESALFVAKAIVAHSHAAAAARPPSLDEAHRFVRTVCGRALFKPCSLIATVVYMDRLRRSELHALIHSDGWQLTLLTLLIIAAKVWDSDFPISNADICAPGALPRSPNGERPLSARRVNEAERRVLAMLDFCTLVQPAEFARYYLTLPFAFPLTSLQMHAGLVPPHTDEVRVTRPPPPPPLAELQLPPSFLSHTPRDRLASSRSHPGLDEQEHTRQEQHTRRGEVGFGEARFGGLVQPTIDSTVLCGLAPRGAPRADSLP